MRIGIHICLYHNDPYESITFLHIPTMMPRCKRDSFGTSQDK